MTAAGQMAALAETNERAANSEHDAKLTAQAALKKAIEIDALADIEIAAADRINQQIQSAAPGSAPILEAQAAAWNVRANAYTQSAMAELMRIRSIDLASASANVKFSAGSNTTLRNATGNVLGRTK